MENYADSKKRIEEISRKYGCKGDIIMRTAIQYIVEYGQNTLSDKDFMDKQIASVISKHDEAEAKGWILFCTRDFEIAILECAAALAEIDIYNLIIYMQKEMYWSNDGGIDYKRLVDIAKILAERVMDDYWEERKDILIDELGIDEDELKYLGFDFEEDEVNNDPAEDTQEEKRGAWMMTNDGAAFCTACKRKMNSYCYGYPHCPMCGVEMGGKADE